MNLLNLFYGVSGLLVTSVVYVLFLKKLLNKTQVALLAALALTPFAVYAVWDLLNLNIEGGQGINLGLFWLSNGIYDVLPWLICIILPVIFVCVFMIISKNLKWPKRILLPLLLCAIIILINIFSGAHILKGRIIDNDPSGMGSDVVCDPVFQDNSGSQCPSIRPN